jgi:hypothetical protein
MKTVSIAAKNITKHDLLKIPEGGLSSVKYRGRFRRPLAIIHHENNVYIPVVDNHKVTTVKFGGDDKISVRRPKYVKSRVIARGNNRLDKKIVPPVKNDAETKLVQQQLFGNQEELDKILGY